MAHIFRAQNKNQEEVEAFIHQQVQQQRKAYEEKKAERPKTRILAICVLLACIAAAAILVFKDGLLTDIRLSVEHALARWSDGLWVAGTDGKSIFHLAIQLVCKILSLICLVLSLVSPLLVPVVLFALLSVIAFFAFGFCVAESGEFDEEAARAKAESAMDGELQATKAGVEGEKAALRAISGLSDECYIFANLVVDDGHGHNETDLIVVSPTGLTVMEVKNYSGLLSGDLSDQELIQRKYQKNGSYTEDKARNPVRQMDTPIRRLSHYLRDIGIAVNIRRCALFINENVQFQLTDRAGLGSTCPLFLMGSAELLNYLHTQGDQKLKPAEIQRIVTALKKQM